MELINKEELSPGHTPKNPQDVNNGCLNISTVINLKNKQDWNLIQPCFL